jgi:hypothetical protein
MYNAHLRNPVLPNRSKPVEHFRDERMTTLDETNGTEQFHDDGFRAQRMVEYRSDDRVDGVLVREYTVEAVLCSSIIAHTCTQSTLLFMIARSTSRPM